MSDLSNTEDHPLQMVIESEDPPSTNASKIKVGAKRERNSSPVDKPFFSLGVNLEKSKISVEQPPSPIVLIKPSELLASVKKARISDVDKATINLVSSGLSQTQAEAIKSLFNAMLSDIKSLECDGKHKVNLSLSSLNPI